LAARRPHGVVELGQQPAPGAVGRDHDPFGLQLVERLDPCSGPELDTCLCRGGGEPPHEPRRLQRAVPDVKDRTAEVRTQQGRQVVAPLTFEAVFAQGFELSADLGAFFIVRCESQAASSPERVAGEVFEAIKLRLRRPYVSRATSYLAAPPRSAKPPFRPLAPSATPRRSRTRTRLPACASVSAQEQPVMPAPMISTSTASSLEAESGMPSSVSQNGVSTPRC
jgi:hypothetical protein